MAINRIQFQAGVSMPEFFSRYGTEEQCAAALQTLRRPQGFVAHAATPPSTTSWAAARAASSSAAAAGTRPR
jgi:hypothetical protein